MREAGFVVDNYARHLVPTQTLRVPLRVPASASGDRGQSSELWCYHELNAVSSGSSSAVERQLPKLDVAGSIPVSRSSSSTLYGSLVHPVYRRVQKMLATTTVSYKDFVTTGISHFLSRDSQRTGRRQTRTAIPCAEQ